MSPKALRILSSVGLLATLAVNALANILPINGLDTGEVSARYPSLFTPAGITFSIWSVIYLLLIGFVVHVWRNPNDKKLDQVLVWFIPSCILNLSWILIWHNLLVAGSVIVMLLLLAVLFKIFLTIRQSNFTTTAEMVLVSLPFTLYFGWICVATIANISAWLVTLNWSGGYLSEEGWTIVMMATAAVLAYVVTARFETPAFIVVVMWALTGIFLRWQKSDHSLIATSAIVLVGMLAIVLVYFSRKRISH